MSADQRRRRGLLARIAEDPWRKLLAVVLAVLFWFFVDARVNQRIERTLPLSVVTAQVQRGAAIDRLAVALPERVNPRGFASGDKELKEVKVVIKGPRFKVAALENEPLDLQIRKFLQLDWGNRPPFVEFTAADLPHDERLLQDVEVEFEPARIVLQVDHISGKTFPLTLDAIEIDEGDLRGRLRRDTAEITPATATVLGASADLEKFVRQGSHFRVRMAAGNSDPRASGQIKLVNDTGKELTLEATHVLTMQVLPQTSKFAFELPILVDDLALPPDQRGTYQPETKTLTVRIAAGGELRSRLVNAGEGDSARAADWAAANLRLLVTIPRPDAGSVLPPELDRPARLVISDRRLFEVVDRNECLLDEGVVVKLRKK